MNPGKLRRLGQHSARAFHTRSPRMSATQSTGRDRQPGSLLALAWVILLSACHTALAAGTTDAPAVPKELLQQPYLFEVVRYLYRWHLDESEVERIVGEKNMVFWVHRLEHKLDPGDRSILGEILLPQLDLVAKVKKADYTIEETGVAVKSPNFRITQIRRGQLPANAPPGSAVVEVDMKEMRDYLFRTRSQHDFPDAALVERLRQALRKEAAKQGILSTNAPTGEQIVHLAPLSPVANDTWVFWEAGRKLFYFASDIDLANPAVWEHQSLAVRIFDLDEQVVVSHEKAPESNRFLTRYQVSRALFNCILLGQRVVVPPYVPAPGTAPSSSPSRPSTPK